METKRKWQDAVGRIVYALLAAAGSMVCVMGYYPLVPAFYAACCLQQKKNGLLYIGLLAGMWMNMPVASMVKYLFILLVSGIGIRFYRWANRRCGGFMGGLVAGLSTTAMNCSGMALLSMGRSELILGICEGGIAFGATIVLHYVMQMASELVRSFTASAAKEGSRQQTPEMYHSKGKITAFTDAVEGLSAAFASMGRTPGASGHESVAVLEKEVTGKLCAACEGCAVCWEQKDGGLPDKVRRMLKAVVAHRPKEEIMAQNYIEECPLYSGMVEEAIWAFSRMELNEAWYKRLQENRMVIADQLDAMSDLLLDWTRERRCVDAESKVLLARIGFEVRERGLVAEQVHIYEDAHSRRSVSAMVASKWGGGIPSRNYVRALERACGMKLRLQKDARSILTKDAVALTVYEDTCLYALSGVTGRKKDGEMVSGDNFSIFTTEDGRYFICLSDGMGSGPAASKESDLVVDLMEKFMEAGFPRETAIRMMNSAMVMQGEDNSFSTMDFAAIDLYTGELEITKIGAACSFLRTKEHTSPLAGVTLPAGADSVQVAEPVKIQLHSGDFLVMVTDGVLEYLHVKNPEEKLADIISEIRTGNAGNMAEAIMERVLLFTGGHAMDDMTIIVTGVWEQE